MLNETGREVIKNVLMNQELDRVRKTFNPPTLSIGELRRSQAPVSSCCRSRVQVYSSDEGTNFYYCVICNRACDAIDPHKLCQECWFEFQNGHARDCSQLHEELKVSCPNCDRENLLEMTELEKEKFMISEGTDNYPDQILHCRNCGYWVDKSLFYDN